MTDRFSRPDLLERAFGTTDADRKAMRERLAAVRVHEASEPRETAKAITKTATDLRSQSDLAERVWSLLRRIAASDSPFRDEAKRLMLGDKTP